MKRGLLFVSRVDGVNGQWQKGTERYSVCDDNQEEIRKTEILCTVDTDEWLAERETVTRAPSATLFISKKGSDSECRGKVKKKQVAGKVICLIRCKEGR